MILTEAEAEAMAKNVTGCCGKISPAEVSTLVISHEKLRAIIRCLKNSQGCWCEPMGGQEGAHTGICNEIRKRVI